MAENTIIHEISLAGYKATSTGGMLDLGTWGSYGIEKLHLTLDAAWQDLTITAFFNVKGKVVAKKVVRKDGYADVPWEATKESTFAGRIVFEGSINGQRRITTDLNYKVTNHSEITDIDPVPTDDRWNQFVTETKEYRDGAFEAAERANARAEDAEAASEDSQAAARAAKASEDAAKVSENAAAASEGNAKISAGAAAVSEGNAAASADKAKASETAATESASNAAEDAAKAASAAKKAADESVAANIAAIEKMQADVASKQTAAAASEKAAAASAVAAAGNAAQAETQKAAAAKSASDAQGYMQTASGAATAANASAENAAGSKAAAESSASAAAGSEQAAGASELKAAKSEKAAAESAQAALESKTAAATSETNAAASAKKAQDVADSLPADYTTAVNEITALKTNKADKTELDTVKQQVENITPDDSAIGDKPWSSKNIVDMLCPPLEESGNPVVCYPVAGYPLGVKASWEPAQEGSGTPSPENIRPIKGRASVTVNRADGLRAWRMLTLDGTEEWTVSGKFLDNKTDWYYVSSEIPDAINIQPQKGNEICSHYPHADVANNNTVQGCAIVWGSIRVRWGDTIPNDADAWKAYLAAQNAAGTPVQIVYKLATPTPFTATGAQPIPALAGANTVLTDADSATVTGRADPIKRIEDLEAAVASIE